MTGTLPTKNHYDVLNAVVLKQMAGSDAVASATGIATDDVEKVLVDLERAGLLVRAGDAAAPSADAVPALTDDAAVRFDGLRRDPVVLAEVDRFEVTNSQLLTTMTRWQTIEVGGRQMPNDHTDASYDDRIVDRVERLVRRLDPLVDALAGHDPRFRRYRDRFDAALDAVDRGDRDFVSSPLRDSVHTIWFEFHEDLLRALGRRRVE